MRAHFGTSVVACLAVAGTFTAAVGAAPQPPEAPPTVALEVRLTAAPAFGAIPLAFVRNQFEYCSVICPYVLQGAITIPLAAVQTPATFVGALASSGSLLKAIGAAAASVTGPANAAADPIITNDLSLVLPKAQHALNVSIVEAFNVGAALSQPGEFLAAVQTARSRILGALDEPMGPPTTPTGARHILQVVAVEYVNVVSAVLFEAGELALLGVVQTADAAAQELARSGDPAAALAAGAAQARQTAEVASARVVSAVETAVTNVRKSLEDPFPSTASTRQPTVSPESTAERDDSEQPSGSDKRAKPEADTNHEPSDENQTPTQDRSDSSTDADADSSTDADAGSESDSETGE